ncbi:hypothetical protein A7976_06830 [Methylobacillus sp. MM3]|uniref:DUF488 domain-containing protein n=1 Tax=Methylobacillus sp. MM3 TaxID=1848039 RepID=UPI0007E1598D|nr:DUF488 domain-containing protein [Methylobacillus sp. MM3]OAJ71145.1 hypothetical protein A7976_06830 [Methylobacillus sp. MM3]
MSLTIKRIYEPAAPKDGFRILIDRIWPRGLSKASASVDLWFKTLAPSTELRQWFGHDPEKWVQFRQRYFAELDGQAEAVDQVLKMAKRRRVTLLYGAKDTLHNNAVALMEYLDRGV